MDLKRIIDTAARYVSDLRPRRQRAACLFRPLRASNFRQLLDTTDGLSELQLRAADAWAADLDVAANSAVNTLTLVLEGLNPREIERLVALACVYRYCKLVAWSPAATENAMSMYSLYVFGRKSFGRFVTCDRHLPMRTETGILSAVLDLVVMGDLDRELRSILIAEIKPRIDAARAEIQSMISARAERARALAATKRARDEIDGTPRRGPGRPRKHTQPTNQTEMEEL